MVETEFPSSLSYFRRGMFHWDSKALVGSCFVYLQQLLLKQITCT